MIQIQRGVLHDALKSVAMFQSTDEMREHLCSVLFESVAGVLHIVATDGYAMAHAKPIVKDTSTAPAAFLFTSSDVKILLSTLKGRKNERGDDLSVTFGTEFTISGPGINFTLRTKLNVGTYPPFRAVEPERLDTCSAFTCNPAYLERVGKACLAFGPKLAAAGVHPVQPNCNSKYEPIRFDYTHPDTGALILVVMPIRV